MWWSLITSTVYSWVSLFHSWRKKEPLSVVQVATTSEEENTTQQLKLQATLSHVWWHTSILVPRSAPPATVQLLLLTHFDTVLRCACIWDDLSRMTHIFDSLVPRTLDSIETGAFTSTLKFLYQRSVKCSVNFGVISQFLTNLPRDFTSYKRQQAQGKLMCQGHHWPVLCRSIVRKSSELLRLFPGQTDRENHKQHGGYCWQWAYAGINSQRKLAVYTNYEFVRLFEGGPIGARTRNSMQGNTSRGS